MIDDAASAGEAYFLHLHDPSQQHSLPPRRMRPSSSKDHNTEWNELKMSQYMPSPSTLFLIAYMVASFSMVSSSKSPSSSFIPSARGEARLFLDTAVESDWTELLPLGIFHGVTTNPVLLERAGHPCTVEHLHSLADKVLSQTNEFMCQSWGESSDDLYQVGMSLSSINRDQIVIKVPVTKQGTIAASQLINAGVRVCLTACYSSHQALIASGVGAEYIVSVPYCYQSPYPIALWKFLRYLCIKAPYLGRMNDSGVDGMDECRKMQHVVNGLKSKTRILVASIRNVESMIELASGGLDTFTFSPDVARALFICPSTDQAAADFEAAARRCSSNGNKFKL